MSSVNLGPWPLGIDNVSADTQTVKGAVVDAVNGNLSRQGEFSSRSGRTEVTALPGACAVWTSPILHRSYCAADGVLYRLTDDLQLVALGALGSNETPSFCDLLDRAVVGTQAGLFTLDSADIMRPLGLNQPGAPSVTATASGGLTTGRYGVAVTTLRGDEESGLSPVTFVDLPEGGGMSFTLAAPLDTGVTSLRLYRTTANGDVLYRAADVPLGMPTYLLGNAKLGRAADTMYRVRLPGGQIVRYGFGRLFVARGKTLYFSDAMRYGQMSERENFITFPYRIELLELLSDGIFIGHAGGVFYMADGDPDKWHRSQISSWPPVFGSGTTLEATELSDKLQESVQGACAVWLTERGYLLGVSGGRVLSPQATRTAVTPAKVGATVVHQRRIITTEVL